MSYRMCFNLNYERAPEQLDVMDVNGVVAASYPRAKQDLPRVMGLTLSPPYQGVVVQTISGTLVFLERH